MARRARRVAAATLAALVVFFLTPGAADAQEPPPAARAAETLLDVPFIPQSELLCGGAAAAMVLRYWGADEVDAEDFRALVRPDEGGIRGGELASDLRGRGWRALPFRGSGAELRHQLQRGRPVIALLEVEPERYHFVVVVAWTERGVIYHDPARAPFRVRSASEFEAAWEASDRWTLLVLPADDEDPAAAERPGSVSAVGPLPPPSNPAVGPGPEADSATEGRSGPDTAQGPTASRPEGRCREQVRAAVENAGAGNLAAAETLLTEAVRSCPGSARAHAELAGLRARQDRWEEARDLARQATDLDPAEPHAWRLLATSRFLTDDRAGALAAWNRIGEPRIERVRIQGLGRTRYEPVRARLTLGPDQLLTRGALLRSSRRLALLPVAAATRVDYVPSEEGRVEVRAAVLERPLMPSSVAAWVGVAARGALQREVSVSLAGPTGSGELWTPSFRYEEGRPRLALDVTVPAAPLLPGVVSVGLGWERQSYRLGTAATGAGEASGEAVVTEERRGATVRSTDWATGRLRWEAGGGVHRWEEGPTDVSLLAGLELRTLSNRFSVRAEGLLAASATGDRSRRYGRARLGAAWRSSSSRQGPLIHLRLAGTAVTESTPLTYWPGAGSGRARRGLLRGHPLLDDGIVSGPGFGRRLLHGGAEVRWWLPLPGTVAVAPAVFVDLARPWHRPGAAAGRLEVDAGAGLRLSSPGRSGMLRADLARGIRSGGWRFEAAWETPWPGRGER